MEAGTWREWECCLSVGLFDELCTIPDLAKVEAAIDEKNLRVKAKKATLAVGNEIH